MVGAAIEHVAVHEGQTIEAYPTLSSKEELPPVSSFMGVPDLFLRAGFKEVSRPSKSRIIMRYRIHKD
jgi:hypothetical protein